MKKLDIARKVITFLKCDERHEIFAPSWELLMSYKRGEINWEEYTEKYYSEMRLAYRQNKEIFIKMADRLDEVEFICWCNNKKVQNEKCHRFLLRDILEKIRERYKK